MYTRGCALGPQPEEKAAAFLLLSHFLFLSQSKLAATRVRRGGRWWTASAAHTHAHTHQETLALIFCSHRIYVDDELASRRHKGVQKLAARASGLIRRLTPASFRPANSIRPASAREIYLPDYRRLSRRRELFWRLQQCAAVVDLWCALCRNA